jgi:lipopolysaccharide export system protein LptA
LYIYTMLQTAGYGTKPIPPSISATIDKEIAMDNPRYNGFSKDGGTYTVTAVTAIPDLANPTQMKLNQITGELYDAKKSRTDLTATRGFFDNKASQLDLFDGITVVTQTGMRANLRTATLMTKEGTIVSKTPVEVLMPSGTVTSNRMNLNQKTRDVTFQDAVVAHLIAPPKPEAAAPLKPTLKPNVPGAPNAFGNSKAPVDITSDRLDIHDAKKTAQFSGRVRAVQAGAALETNILDIAYVGGGKDAAQPGAPADTPPADPAQPAAKIQRIVVPGPLVLTQPTGERVTGDAADFDAINETAVITGTVTMVAGVDRRATADRAEFQQKSDTILLTGNVVVNQARNELRGRRMLVDRKAGTTALTSPAEGALAASRIFARLYQGDGQPPKPGAAAGAPKKVAEAAAGAAAGMTAFKSDPNAPVDIEADKLNVDDNKKLAIFYGNVKAAQGDFNVQTVELHATYSGEAGLASSGPPQPGAPPKTPAQLTRIEALGKVVVTSKNSQTVTGDKAVFDTKANTVAVSGKEVVVSQDKNILTCTLVVIDMTTGQYNCPQESTQTAPVGAAGIAGEPTKPGRKSLIIYPGDAKKNGGAPAAPAPAKPASSSWESTTAPNK